MSEATAASRRGAAGAAARARTNRLIDRLQAMTLAELWLFLAVALPTLAGVVAGMSTVDLAWQLRAGSEILGGSFPSVDTWTFTAAGTEWTDQQWLAQAVLAIVHGLLGWTGLVILRAALIGAIFGFVAAAIRRRNPALGHRTVAALTLMAFAVASPALGLRPQLFGMALFAATLWLLAGRHRRGASRRELWAIPALALLWANIHGSFVFAPILVFLAALEDAHDRDPGTPRMLFLGLVTLAATVVTPFGLGTWGYALGLAASPEVRNLVTEWQPTTLRDIPGIVFWLSVAAAAVFLMRRGERATWPQLITLGLFAVVGMYAARGIAWWPLVAAVVVGSMLAPPGLLDRSRRTPRPSSINGAIAAGLVVVGVVLLPTWRATDPGTGAPQGFLKDAPSGITAELNTLQPGDVWNPQAWGSWFEYRVPQHDYVVDSRIELYPGSVWREVQLVSAGAVGWDDVLKRYEVDFVVIEDEATSQLAAAMEGSRWCRIYADVDGSIWTWAENPRLPVCVDPVAP